VGDSRVYLRHEGKLRALTRDHSLLVELTERGVAPHEGWEEAYRNQLTRALGVAEPRPELVEVTAERHDVFVCCTDGLYTALPEARWDEALELSSARAAADRLVELALAAGATDNVTAVVVRC